MASWEILSSRNVVMNQEWSGMWLVREYWRRIGKMVAGMVGLVCLLYNS
jgi:hypothetical protein